MLLASGLVNIKGFWPIPNYKYPDHFVALEDDAHEINRQVDGVKQFLGLKKEIVKTVNQIGMLSYLAETISFVAQRMT